MLRIPTDGPPTHPGEMLQEEFLAPLGLSQKELAERIDVPVQRVNLLVNRKRGVTPDTALRLARFFGTTAQFWLNGQIVWDLYQETHSRRARAIDKISPLRKSG